jgi:hypothetical protein
MTFSPAELVLLVALVLTSACVMLMYRKLETLSASQVDYRRALVDSARALDAAHDEVAALNRDGQNVVLSLCLKINEAQALLGEIDRRPQPYAGNVTPIRLDKVVPRSAF